MSTSGDEPVQERRRADSDGSAGGANPRVAAADGGLNLKPSGRVHAASALTEERAQGRTLGQVTVENPVFSSRDVNVYYGPKHALKNVSIDVGRKQVLAMIGPSGCGKSTFLRCLNRMNDTIPGARVTGSIRLDGLDIHDKHQDVVQIRARVG